MFKKLCYALSSILLVSCAVNGQTVNGFSAEIVKMHEKVQGVDVSVELVKTNNAEINQKLEKDYCETTYYWICRNSEKLIEQYPESYEFCAAQLCKSKTSKDAFADYNKTLLDDHYKSGFKPYSLEETYYNQEYKFIGNHYFQVCKFDSESAYGYTCWLYDIQNPNKPVLLEGKLGMYALLTEQQQKDFTDLVLNSKSSIGDENGNELKLNHIVDIVKIAHDEEEKDKYAIEIIYEDSKIYKVWRYDFNADKTAVQKIIPSEFLPE